MEYKPTICIKLGIAGIGRLGGILASRETGWHRNVNEFYSRPYVINLTKQNHHLKIVFINHPTGSRGFSYSKWATIIQNQFPDLSQILGNKIINNVVSGNFN